MQANATQPDCGLGYVVMFMMPAILLTCALLGSVAGVADWLAFVPFGNCVRDRAAIENIRDQLE